MLCLLPIAPKTRCQKQHHAPAARRRYCICLVEGGKRRKFDATGECVRNRESLLVKQAEIRSRRVAIGASSARTLQQPPATTPESLCLSGPAARIAPNRFGETLLRLHVLLVLSGVLAIVLDEHNIPLTVASRVGVLA